MGRDDGFRLGLVQGDGVRDARRQAAAACQIGGEVGVVEAVAFPTRQRRLRSSMASASTAR